MVETVDSGAPSSVLSTPPTGAKRPPMEAFFFASMCATCHRVGAVSAIDHLVAGSSSGLPQPL